MNASESTDRDHDQLLRCQNAFKRHSSFPWLVEGCRVRVSRGRYEGHRGVAKYFGLVFFGSRNTNSSWVGLELQSPGERPTPITHRPLQFVSSS